MERTIHVQQRLMRKQKEYYDIDEVFNIINRIVQHIVHICLCLVPGGVQTAGIQWNSQIFHQCCVWPRHWTHLDE